MTTPTDETNETPSPREIWSEEHPDTHLERDDDRWSKSAQVRDWLVLILMIATYLVWMGIVYFLEPGIR